MCQSQIKPLRKPVFGGSTDNAPPHRPRQPPPDPPHQDWLSLLYSVIQLLRPYVPCLRTSLAGSLPIKEYLDDIWSRREFLLENLLKRMVYSLRPDC